MKYDFDCVIVGAGIAGMTAAIYLKRSNVNVLILDNSAPGGLLNKISKIENYPGYISISGPELAYNIYEQVNKLGIEIRYGNVISIENHIIKTDIEEISANKIILAAGRKAIKLKNSNDISNISYCALCDANLYKNEVVAIVGNGNQLLEETEYLSSICKKVIIICHDDEIVGEGKLKENINDNVQIYTNCFIKNLETEGSILKNIVTNKGTFSISGLFISLGYEPNVDFFKGINIENGYILVDDKMKTNIDYIYACGDIIKKDIYQLTTAVGEATIAAVNIKKQLK